MLKRKVKATISLIIVVCLVVSAIPVFSPRVQAEDGQNIVGKTLPLFAMNQLYARGLMVAGMALGKVAEASGSEDFQKAAAIINKFVFGNNTTAQDLAEIKAMCNTIIAELDAIEKQLNGIEQTLAEGEIADAYERVSQAWEDDVQGPIDAVNNGELSNMLKAYEEYVKSAYSYETQETISVMNQQGVVVEMIATESLVNYWDTQVYTYLKALSGETYKYDPDNPQLDEDAFYKDVLYNTYTIDDIFASVTDTLTSNLAVSSSITSGDRYIDRAAQFAYINFPYSSQQKDFVAMAVKNQATEISLIVMLYQDFMGRRADYFKELYEAKAETTTDAEALEEYKTGLDTYYATRESRLYTLVCGTDELAGVIGKINNWLDGKIYIQNTADSSYLYYDNYMGSESAGTSVFSNTNYYDNLDFDFYYTESEEGRLGEHISDIRWSLGVDYIDEYITPAINKANEKASIYGTAVTFNKNAVVKAVAGAKAEIVPIAFLEAEDESADNMYLKNFDMKWDVKNHADYHVPSDDYYNLVRSVYTDGKNTYTAIESATEIKGLINSTHFQAKGSVIGNVFPELVSYSGSNPVYLLTSEYPTTDEHGGLFVKTTYSGTKGVNLKESKTYSDTWSSETNCQYYLQDDRDGSENKTNQMYAVMLTANVETVYSKINFATEGNGTYTYAVEGTTEEGNPVYDSTTGDAVAGSTATITITPESHSEITKVTIQYHNNGSDTSLVTSEQVIYDSATTVAGCELDESGALSFGYPVTYTNVTFLVEVDQVEFEKDEKGNFIIETYDDLMKMASRVNSGEEKYVTGSYIIVNDIQCEVSAWEYIGTNEDGFMGVLDGQGHSIIGLNDQPLSIYNDGLFKTVGYGGEVKNVVLSDCTFSTHQYEKARGIAGVALVNNGYIHGCVVIDSEITSNSFSDVGGIVGENTIDGRIVACAVINTSLKRNLYSAVGVSGIADTNKGVVESCYTYNCTFSNYSDNADYNGVIINSGDAPVNSCYYTTSSVMTSYGTALTQEEFAQGKAAYILNGNKSDDSVNWFQNLDNGLEPDIYPVVTNNGKNNVYKVNHTEKEYSNYPNGEGTLEPTEDGVFEIYTYYDLLLASASINSGRSMYLEGTYKLMNDISVGDNWVPAGTKEYKFAGLFLGNNNKIDGLNITDLSLHHVGLFGYIGEEGTVKDIEFTNVSLATNIQAYAGTVAVYNYGTINNCSAQGEISTVQWNEGDGYSTSCIGGIATVNYGTINNCFNDCDITVNKTSLVAMVSIGGISATNYGIIEHCGNTADLETSAIMVNMAGIAGKNGASLTDYSVNNCYNTGNQIVSAVNPEFVDFDFVNSYLAENGANITVNSMDELNALLSEEAVVFVGGLVGDSDSAIVKNSFSVGGQLCYYEGSIGGLYGKAGDGAVTNSYYLVGDDAVHTDGAMKYASQFESGEVAYKLESGNTQSVWGQRSNTSGSLPCFTTTPVYKVSVIEAGGYSVAGIGDINGDGTVNVDDYQQMVNIVVSDNNDANAFEDEVAFVRADINADGYVDALDGADMQLLVNAMGVVDIYAPGDFDGDGFATEEDAQNITKVIEGTISPNKAQWFACDLNGDGVVDWSDIA